MKDLDVVVLGATGLTGRLVAAHLAGRAPETAVRWAVAGRSPQRLADVLTEVGAPTTPSLVVDLGDEEALRLMASRTHVVLNLAGPYSRTASAVVAACVAGGSSYADLSGEVPAVARLVRRRHEPARRAGVRVVPVSGYEALPADLAVLLAAQRAEQASRGGAAVDDGPGAGGDVTAVAVTFRTTPPSRRLGLTDAVSGGTLQSLVEVLADDDARRAGDPAALVVDHRAAAAVRRTSPLALRPRVVGGRVVGPVVPAAFIDPPVLHRTAALLAEERGEEHRPAALAEGADMGPAGGTVGAVVLAAAGAGALLQRGVLAATHLPGPLRRGLAGLLARVLPGSGEGPSADAMTGWRWQVRAEALAADGARGTAVVEGVDHPGYAATARMLAEVGLRLAATADDPPRTGCLTPALVMAGPDGAAGLAAAGVHVS
ncbi:saccharopine dehydrogenase NADP-binding domain-containing protein [Pseudokineococcus lusitanus]|uniref:Short subunit dehydrogenase-like uncharacterized protein n=1 Tax=Pseudokineococcus lusitanus TaxID=763993 RepID=A0A3N1HKA7_9ACTN|nr:saccharopine dehydrogenase NADP-binding domain-containing protein [Pseudokineococcus lusitanus]ROP42924.1 short subunit dehydrogenase-like uncharacterized protein [Pseudokineococcus lusitanus]